MSAMRPAWCPHADCTPLRATGGGALCAGLLPAPADHGEAKGVNTHRLCMNDGESPVVDWQIAEHDCDWFRHALDAIDGKETTWLSQAAKKARKGT